jgi:hypothetical protein
MTTVRAKIDEAWLRKLIAEELRSLDETMDHEGIRGVVNTASKLLKAVEAFEKDANASMTNAVTPALSGLKSTLESMVTNAGGYVDRPTAAAQTIKLRQVDND